jgi:hypothetical protein
MKRSDAVEAVLCHIMSFPLAGESVSKHLRKRRLFGLLPFEEEAVKTPQFESDFVARDVAVEMVEGQVLRHSAYFVDASLS